MKIFLIFFILSFFIIPFYLSADEDSLPKETVVDDVFPVEFEKSKYLENRKIEFEFIKINVGISNNHFSFSEIFQEKLIINLDDFEDDFKVNLGAAIYPLSFRYHVNDNWGLGFSTGITAIGMMNLSKNMLTFSSAVDENSEAGGAAFFEIRLHGFFSIKKFKINIKPALYYSIFYTEPEISYTYNNTNSGTVLNMGYNFRVYSAWNLDTSSDDNDFSALPGADFNVSAEYPLSEVLGLKNKSKLLDFNIGLDLKNIPIYPSSLTDYMEKTGRIGSDNPIDILDENTDFSSLIADNPTVYGDEKKYILRPFKMLVWADWHPFETRIISFIPSVGMAINPLYNQMFSAEGGIKVRFDFFNRFIAVLGMNYEDRFWKNSISMALNFRAIEFDLGASLQSPDFLKSFSSGVGLEFGIKLGW